MTAIQWICAAVVVLFVISVGLTIAVRRAEARVCEWAEVTGDEAT